MRPLLFISYARRDAALLDEFLKYLRPPLEETPYDVFVDTERIKAGERWHTEIAKAIDCSEMGLLFVTPEFLNSEYIRGEEAPRLMEARKRGLILTWIHYEEAPYEGSWFDKLKYSALQALCGVQPPVRAARRRADRLSRITQICRKIRESLPALSRRRGLQSGHRRGGLSLYRSSFPITSETLVGRDDVLERLDRAWRDPHTHVLSLIASGGTGKSAVIDHWYAMMAAENFRGARRVFVWSFYGQGTSQQVSSDAFLEEAFKFFRVRRALPVSGYERGRLLADQVRRYPTLLILDGIEPLQDVRKFVNQYPIRDSGLAALLESLAAHNNGLCLVSSRFPIAQLAAQQVTAPHELLPPLSIDSGANLLKVLGVRGQLAERRRISERCGGHALTLDLLGRYLANTCQGDPGQANRFFDMETMLSGEELSHPAQRVMRSYEQWFSRTSGGVAPEVRLLYLLGLFDRPATSDEIDALRCQEIPDLSDRLAALDGNGMLLSLAQLATAGLLSYESRSRRNAADSPGYIVDAHPLVRSYFTSRLRRDKPAAWQAGHRCLFRHLRRTSAIEPATAIELAPLYAAIRHACLAGDYDEALELYWERIHQRMLGIAHRFLGINDAEVAMIGHFFERKWTKPVASLPDRQKASVLGIASSRVRALGDLDTALRLARDSFAHYYKVLADELGAATVPIEDDRREDGLSKRAVAPDLPQLESTPTEMQRIQVQLAVRARHQAELRVLLGQLQVGRETAERACSYANDSQQLYELASEHSVLGWALHQLGGHQEALLEFQRSEDFHRARRLPRKEVYSLWGYRYCDLLLDLVRRHSDAGEQVDAAGKLQEVRRRAEQALQWAQEDRRTKESDPFICLGLIDEPLARLMLVQAEIARAEFEQDSLCADVAGILDRARHGFQGAGKKEFLPLYHLVSARWHRFAHAQQQARRDLDQAFEFTRDMGYCLLEADCHLEALEFAGAFGTDHDTDFHWTRAHDLIQKMGYNRRFAVLRDLEKLLV